ncbi:MAG: hypothetical protein IJ873_09320 [Lachnospiraceae bacterium]|nr:hypothetical protein [Lachnospiraceae bacterium]
MEQLAAKGAAISLNSISRDSMEFTADEFTGRIRSLEDIREHAAGKGSVPFFASEDEKAAFIKEHHLMAYPDGSELINSTVKGKESGLQAYLGIDSDSTTTKFVLMDEDGRVFDSYYSGNKGDPFTSARNGLIRIRDKYDKAGIKPGIKAVCTTGYGELPLRLRFLPCSRKSILRQLPK